MVTFVDYFNFICLWQISFVEACYVLNFTYGVLSYPIMYSDDLLHSCTIRVQPLAPLALTEE